MSWLDLYQKPDPDETDYADDINLVRHTIQRIKMHLNSSIIAPLNVAGEIRDFYTQLMAKFELFNQEYKVGAPTMNDLKFGALSMLWYAQYARTPDNLLQEKRLSQSVSLGKTPVIALYAQKLVDVSTKVATMASLHAPLVNTPVMAHHKEYTFPTMLQVHELMNEVSFIATAVLWKGRKPLSEALDQYATLLYEVQTEEQKTANEHSRSLVHPSTPQLRAARAYLTINEPSDEQGLYWKDELPSYALRFTTMTTYLFTQLEYEYRLKARYAENKNLWVLPFQSRENAHLWMVDRFKHEQPDTLLRNIREQVCEHYLPIGARLHSRRQKSKTDTPIAADILLQRYIGGAVTTKIAMEIASEENLAAIAKSVSHPLYSFVFLAMADLCWMQIGTATGKNLWLYDSYIVPRSLFLFHPLDSFNADLRFNDQPRPRLMLLCNKWHVFFNGEWQTIEGGIKDTVDAVLILLLVLREHFNYLLEDRTDLKEMGERFFGVLRSS
jgi:hypothetical protein